MGPPAIHAFLKSMYPKSHGTRQVTRFILRSGPLGSIKHIFYLHHNAVVGHLTYEKKMQLRGGARHWATRNTVLLGNNHLR